MGKRNPNEDNLNEKAQLIGELYRILITAETKMFAVGVSAGRFLGMFQSLFFPVCYQSCVLAIKRGEKIPFCIKEICWLAEFFFHYFKKLSFVADLKQSYNVKIEIKKEDYPKYCVDYYCCVFTILIWLLMLATACPYDKLNQELIDICNILKIHNDGAIVLTDSELNLDQCFGIMALFVLTLNQKFVEKVFIKPLREVTDELRGPCKEVYKYPTPDNPTQWVKLFVTEQAIFEGYSYEYPLGEDLDENLYGEDSDEEWLGD
ncbi:hypothetical protein H4219_006356 [Mycoemilia scoparia]|uniref:Uncharacterized protein n=1 Tax=Mycoemilia scoparia TaxID=417184 RepID=A0A9W8DIW8_9FUNG|nr:hypothetical protein H4219_006356 [Mycoemilia scoparia]